MSIKILFTCIVISLAALALPVSACDEESGQQTVSVEMLLQKASHADKHTIGVTNKPLSEKKAHMHTSRKGSSDCCEPMFYDKLSAWLSVDLFFTRRISGKIFRAI